jgi:hypothetical protein
MSKNKFIIEPNVLPKLFAYPSEYIEFVSLNSKHNGAMVNLPPWSFASEELWALNESKEKFGNTLVPFAQAEMQDLMAYFKIGGEVILCNPWENTIIENFGSFKEWLAFASTYSETFLVENPHFRERKYWYPSNA